MLQFQHKLNSQYQVIKDQENNMELPNAYYLHSYAILGVQRARQEHQMHANHASQHTDSLQMPVTIHVLQLII